MKQTFQKILCLLAVATFGIVAVASAQDTTQWQVEGAGNTGLYSYGGGTNPLVGAGIQITEVTGEGTPVDSGDSPAVVGGLLSFTTGASTGGWNWGAGGTLTLTGCVQGVTGTGAGHTCQAGDNSTVLLSDGFTSASITPIVGGVGITLGGLQGTMNPLVAAFFGVTTSFGPGSNFSDLVSGLPSAGASFTGLTSTLSGGNLVAQSPEGWSLSSSLGLFGFGLVLIVAARRLGLIKSVIF